MSATMIAAGTDLPKLRGRALPEVLALATLPAEAERLAAAEADVPAAIGALRAAGLLAEASRLTAFALPKREAVWWACMCARAVPAADLPEADQLALTGAEAWVYKPTDENRRAAFAHAQAAGFQTPEAWAAVGAFWSGDSLAPAGGIPVPPADNLTGIAVAGSVALTAVRDKPERRAARLARYLDAAAEIARGGTGRMPAEEG